MNEGTPIIIKKKKGHGEHGHHGGSWKVAYADFVTAMMAFFMVMWIMGLSEDTKAQIQGYFNDPVGFMKNMPQSRNVINIKTAPPQDGKTPGQGTDAVKPSEKEQMKQLQQEVDNAVKDGVGGMDLRSIMKQVETTITPEGLQIELVENTGAVFFESGKAVVRPVARELIGKIAPIIARSHRKIIIEGHTDARPYPSATYTNWDLSTDRALALEHLLCQDGVPDAQVKQVRGYAATKLKKPDDPFHFSNRRVTILLPFQNAQDSMIDLPQSAFEKLSEGVVKEKVGVAPAAIDLGQQMGQSGKRR